MLLSTDFVINLDMMDITEGIQESMNILLNAKDKFTY